MLLQAGLVVHVADRPLADELPVLGVLHQAGDFHPPGLSRLVAGDDGVDGDEIRGRAEDRRGTRLRRIGWLLRLAFVYLSTRIILVIMNSFKAKRAIFNTPLQPPMPWNVDLIGYYKPVLGAVREGRFRLLYVAPEKRRGNCTTNP